MKITLIWLGLAAIALASACGSDTPPPPPPPAFVPWTLDDLASAQGLSFRIPEFDVGSGEEIQDCYFLPVPDLNGNGSAVWINEVKTAINPGSHHFNVFRVKTIVKLDPAMGEAIKLGPFDAKVVRGKTAMGTMSECWKSPNWADWPLIANSQNSKASDPYTDWKLPTDVAFKLTPGEMLMLQTHFVNASTQMTPAKGRVGVNFYRYTGTSTSPTELGTLFATQQSIRICQSNPTPTYSGTCRFGAGHAVTINAMNGHFHSRGTKFEVFRWDGLTETHPADAAKLYTSNRWDEPPMQVGMTSTVTDGGGVWWDCHYQWQPPAGGCDVVNARDKQMANDCCYTFGPIVEASEHCNVFVYYYPKQNDIFCN